MDSSSGASCTQSPGRGGALCTQSPLPGSGGAESVEGGGDEGVGEGVGGQPAPGPVPLGEGVDGAEQQPAGDGRIDVRADAALPLRGTDQVGDDPVELAPPLQRL